jgi:hypothetical protein
LDDGVRPTGGAEESLFMTKKSKKGREAVPEQRRNEVFRILSEKVRKLSEGRRHTPSEVLQRQSRDER